MRETYPLGAALRDLESRHVSVLHEAGTCREETTAHEKFLYVLLFILINIK